MRGVEQTRRTVLKGLAAFRWLAWAWMAVVLVLARGSLVAPRTAVLLVVVAGLVTGWLTWLLRRDPQRLAGPPAVGVEVGVAAAIQLADGFVYAAPHVFTARQPLGVAWPIASVLAAGVALGPSVGAATGALLGAARALSSVANVAPAAEPWLGPLDPEQGLSLLTTTVLYGLAGWTAGYASRLLSRAEHRLLRAERAVAALEAREEMARRLHDGVLQTLAIVERRAPTPELARLARDQERELRAYLLGPVAVASAAVAPAGQASAPSAPPAGGAPVTGVDQADGRGRLGVALRAVADRAETRHHVRTQVLIPDDLPELDAEVVEAVAGAVGEALTNVGKHAAATRIVVYAEPLETEVFVSVRDDGGGFDPAIVSEGMGLARSVRGRIVAQDGRVEVDAAPGRGCEVRLWVPLQGD